MSEEFNSLEELGLGDPLGATGMDNLHSREKRC